jgi:cyclopropane-fatty-acyl-phospholipid synthase
MGLQALVVVVLALVVGLLLQPDVVVTVMNACIPIGVMIMEDTRIPDAVLDAFLRPAMRFGFWALVHEQEGLEVSSQLEYIKKLRNSPIALFTGEANEQHYEVETQFFDLALGARKKYSSGIWDDKAEVATAGGKALEETEEAMLDLYVQRAGVVDGMTVLDLGCGWGSVSLYLAERFPNAKIVGVSNSRTQKKYILGKAAEKGFKNVQIETLNVASDGFKTFLAERQGHFDRVISIEMFEHMKNYGKLLQLLSGALKEKGRLFVHIFCHKHFAYDFEENDLNHWMTKHFFKGGTMPSQYTLQSFQDDLVLQDQWNVNGRNYSLTSEGWLQRTDANKDRLLSVFGADSDPQKAALQVRRWRIFFIACAEFFGFRGGTEWYVTHMLFEKRSK